MQVTLDIYQLTDILRKAALLGAQQALVSNGVIKPYLTVTSAYKLYGRRAVDKWIKEGRIAAYKEGDKNSKVLLDRLELEALVRGEQLIVHFKQAA